MNYDNGIRDSVEQFYRDGFISHEDYLEINKIRACIGSSLTGIDMVRIINSGLRKKLEFTINKLACDSEASEISKSIDECHTNEKKVSRL